MRLRTLAAIAVIGLTGLFAACSDDSGSGRCAQNSDCPGGQVCDSGVCKVAVATRTIGEPCTTDGVCTAGSSCASALPGGLCTYACAGDTCPSGAVCTDLRASGSGFFCSKACTTQADCRTGYTCCAGFGACVPAANCPAQGRGVSSDLGKPCTSNAGCVAVSGEICAGTASAPNAEFPGGACTAACNPAVQNTCPSGSTCVSTSTGSFCFASCTIAADCGNPALVCTAGLCRAPAAPPSCTPNGTAPIAVYQGTRPIPPPAAGSCQRAVVSPTLPSQKFNQQKVGTPVTFNVPPGTGTISILSQGMITGTITTVPGGTQPPDTITFQGSPIANSVVPSLIKDPSGTLLYDDDPPTPPTTDPTNQDAFYGGLSPWAGMMTVPNTSRLLARTALQGSLPAGQWQFTVNDFALECKNPAHAAQCGGSANSNSVYDVQVLLKPGLAPASGTVDVAFYYLTGTASGKAIAAPTNGNFTRMLQGLAQLYAGAGLCLGNVSVYDLPDWAVTRFGGSLNADDDSPCGDLSQLFTLAAPGNQLNFFLVNGFKSGSSGQSINVVGIDGTIPGPSSVGGVVNSGAAVNAADLIDARFCGSGFDPINCGPDEVAMIVGHEGGHYLGLYHTTEQTGDSFDPVSDTKTCSCSVCAPASAQASCRSSSPSSANPTQMFNNYCVSTNTTPQCGGGDNMMFWLLRPESKGTITPQQGQVMRANPIVR